MAKVTGPLMSISASGQFAKTLVFSGWKGTPYVRQLVVPSNPRSAGQILARFITGIVAKAGQAVLTLFNDVLHVGSQFFLDARTAAPSGQSWISYMQQQLHSVEEALNTTYRGLSGTETGRYDTHAATAGLTDYAPPFAVPGTDDATAGFQLYLLASYAVSNLSYAGFAGGIDAASDAELTTFLTYLQTSV